MSERQPVACALLLALLAGACSRPPGETSTLPTSPAPRMSSALATHRAPGDASGSLPAALAVAAADRHLISLRHNRPAGDMPPADGIDVAPGSLPSAASPSGTTFVVQLGDGDDVRVTEWDLATKTVLHEAKLDVPAWDLRLLRAPGSSVRILSGAYNGPLYFVQLTPSLQVSARQELGLASVRGAMAFAGEDDLSVIVADGIPDPTGARDEPAGVFAMVFDASGHRVAVRMLAREEHGGAYSSMMSDNAAVLGGHVYVALMGDGYELHVLRLTRDLRTERERVLPLPKAFSSTQAKLYALDGHLVLDLPDKADLLDLPLDLDLARATRRPRPAPPPDFPDDAAACGPSQRLGSELVALCNCGPQTCLSWAPSP